MFFSFNLVRRIPQKKIDQMGCFIQLFLHISDQIQKLIMHVTVCGANFEGFFSVHTGSQSGIFRATTIFFIY